MKNEKNPNLPKKYLDFRDRMRTKRLNFGESIKFNVLQKGEKILPTIFSIF